MPRPRRPGPALFTPLDVSAAVFKATTLGVEDRSLRASAKGRRDQCSSAHCLFLFDARLCWYSRNVTLPPAGWFPLSAVAGAVCSAGRCNALLQVQARNLLAL